MVKANDALVEIPVDSISFFSSKNVTNKAFSIDDNKLSLYLGANNDQMDCVECLAEHLNNEILESYVNGDTLFTDTTISNSIAKHKLHVSYVLSDEQYIRYNNVFDEAMRKLDE